MLGERLYSRLGFREEVRREVFAGGAQEPLREGFQGLGMPKRRIRRGYPVGCGVPGDEYALSS